MAGYSGTPLAKKLGIKSGFILKIINQPDDFFDFFEEFPENITFEDSPETLKDVIHFFTMEVKNLHSTLKQLKTEIKQNGMIWVSWPKKASKVPTDVNEDIIRGFALETGLVDVKVCAVSKIWSGLKLVIPVKDRK
ncbi:DUF3052 family protein [Flexithrix dorotheae]|uniref:DUF3052 family protein n=1 Tax=Flexithrix dorotheae TaxID=70993 RepID=UPI000374504A|nr:DUF3052 family protein [Flexithrix dorotheae]